MNHYMKKARIDQSIITGSAEVALCSVEFVAHLRVGSGGRADNLRQSFCPDCQEIYDVLGKREDALAQLIAYDDVIDSIRLRVAERELLELEGVQL